MVDALAVVVWTVVVIVVVVAVEALEAMMVESIGVVVVLPELLVRIEVDGDIFSDGVVVASMDVEVGLVVDVVVLVGARDDNVVVEVTASVRAGVVLVAVVADWVVVRKLMVAV